MKTSSVWTVLIMLTAILVTGCGQKSEEPKATPQTPAPTATPAAPAAGTPAPTAAPQAPAGK